MTAADVRSDRVAFARDVLGMEVFEHQVPALRATAPVVAIAGGRRSGKSVASQVAALHCCFTRRGAQWLAISTNQEKVREYLRECVELTRGRAIARDAVLDEQSQRLTFASGSSIIGVLATSGQVRGYGRHVFGATVDEAGFQPEALWRDLRYVMLDHHEEGAQTWMVGSPWGPEGHFFRRSVQLGADGDPDYASFQWATTLNPRVPRAWVERERERLAPSEAAAELDGEWSDAAGSLFSREVLERQTADIEVPELGGLLPPARPIVGCDWGVSFDRSAATAIYRLPVADLNPSREPLATFVALPFLWPQKTPLGTVVDDLVACPAPVAYLSTETNGVGAMPSQELWARMPHGFGRNFNHVAMTALKKTAAYGTLLNLLERGQLVLPRHPDLLRQLAGLKFEQGERGFTRIEADDPATHDDVADSVALATLPYSPGGRARVLCALARLARGHARRASGQVPDAPVGRSGEPIVTTGGGLQVYRRPPLQSVDGMEVTWLPIRQVWTVDPAVVQAEREEALRDRVRAALTTHH